MSHINDEQVNHLEHLVATLERRLRILDTQMARFGVYVPTHIAIEREDVARQIDKTRSDLDKLRPDTRTRSFANITPDQTIPNYSDSITNLSNRSIIIHRFALVCNLFAWIMIVISTYYRLIRHYPSNIILVSITILFLIFFAVWFFSPVTNNSPKYQKFRKSYLQHLIYRHRDLDMRGLSTQAAYHLEQERVFVKLGLIPQPPGRISPSLIPQAKEDLPRRDIDVLGLLQDRSAESQKFAIIGAPGSGKTTLLKHIALTFSNHSYMSFSQLLWKRTPILLFLRDHVEHICWDPELSLPQLIHRSLRSWRLPPPNGWFETELRNNRCIILFDGLDEVADLQSRKQVVAWVEHQIQTYANNSFLITSRPLGYRSTPLSGVNVLQVRPFAGEQVRQFVENWYHQIEVMRSQKDDDGVRMRANEGAKDLLHRLSNAPALTELAANPLLLTMIATIHLYRSRLPGRRVELYSEICEVFLGRRRQVIELDLDLAPLQKQRILEPLAYHMMMTQKSEISLEEALHCIEEPLTRINIKLPGIDFLKMIEESSGLLLERENGIYSFSHQTFQEYLAATHIDKRQLTQQLIIHIENPWWHETTRLYAARSDASDIIAACIQNEKPSIMALTLAIECLNEAESIQPTLRSTIEKLLQHEVEDSDPERRRIVAEALIMQRLRRLSRLNEKRFIDTGLVTNAEYQLFIDEKRDQGLNYQPYHWHGAHFPIGTGHIPVSGIRPSDAEAFCLWLTERDRGGKYQIPLAEEGNVYTKESNNKLGYWVYSRRHGFDCEGIGSIEDTSIHMAIAYRIAHDLINLQICALLKLLENIYQEARKFVKPQHLQRDIVDDQKQIRSILETLVLIQTLLQALIGTLDHTSAQAFSHILTKVQSLARQSATDLTMALESAFLTTKAQIPESALATAKNDDIARSSARQSAQARAGAMVNMATLVKTLTDLNPSVIALRNALTEEFIHNEELMQYLNPNYAHAQTIFRAITDMDSIRSNLMLHMRAYIYMPNVNQFQKLIRNQSFILEHKHAEECLHIFDRNSTSNSNSYENTVLQRAYIRYWSLLNALITTTTVQNSQQKNVQRSQSHTQKQRQFSVCRGLYLDFAILEERINGHILPVEGIRIVKEMTLGSENS